MKESKKEKEEKSEKAEKSEKKEKEEKWFKIHANVSGMEPFTCYFSSEKDLRAFEAYTARGNSIYHSFKKVEKQLVEITKLLKLPR